MAEQQNGCTPSDCASCAQGATCGKKPVDLHEPANPYSHVNKVIAVVSGKGGVGKSIHGNRINVLARMIMREQGFSVGIMDATLQMSCRVDSEDVWYSRVVVIVTSKGSDAGMFPLRSKGWHSYYVGESFAGA